MSLKRTASEYEAELSDVEAQLRELEERRKRLKTERDALPEVVAARRAKWDAKLRATLPDYLYEQLVAHPLDPDKYGALLNIDFDYEHDVVRGKNHTYSDRFTISVLFERRSIEYQEDEGGFSFSRIVFPPNSKTLTQEQLWQRALACNKNDVGAAFIVLYRDCYIEIDDFEDEGERSKIAAPLRDMEVYRRARAALPHVTAELLKSLYATDAFTWAKGRLKEQAMVDLVRKVNEKGDLFA